MSVIKIAFSLYSKSKIKELILLLEISLMIMGVLVSTAPINAMLFRTDSTVEHMGGVGDLIYCSDNQVIDDSIYGNSDGKNSAGSSRLEMIIPEDVKVNARYETFITHGKSCFADIQNPSDGQSVRVADNFNIVVYSDDLLSRVKLQLDSKYKNILYESDATAIPVVVSPGVIAAGYNVGDIVAVELEDDDEKSFQITGVLEGGATVLSFAHQTSSNTYLNHLSSSDISDPDILIMLVTGKSETLKHPDGRCAVVLSVSGNASKVAARLADANGHRYIFKDVKKIIKFGRNEAIRKEREALRMIIMIGLVMIFNYLGYIVINIKQNARRIAIYNICGLSHKKSVIANIISVCGITIPGMMLGVAGAMTEGAGLTARGGSYHWLIIAVMLVAFVLMILLGVVLAHIRRKNSTAILMYKEG